MQGDRSGSDRNAEHAAILRQHFAAPNPASPYHTLGRYLLGLESEAVAVAHATNPSRTCEAGYYIGLRAESEGRFRDASDWYRVAVETHSLRDAEYEYARDRLIEFSDERKSPTRREAEARAGR